MAGIGINGVTESVRSAARGGRAAAAPRIAEFLLAALAAFLLARLALSLFAPLPAPEGAVLAAASGAPKPQASVTARNPFPQVETVAAAPDAAPDVAETSLDLTLTGVWPGENGSAIIRKPDGVQERFAIGDTIVPGVTLAAVYSDQALIEQNGVREALRFESKIGAPAPVRPAPASAPAGVSPANTAVNAAASLTQFVRLAPARDASGAPAIAVYGGADRRAFDQAGLQDGDILKTVNGAPAPLTPNELAALVTQITRAGSASLVVERGGRTQQVTLSLQESGNE